jgi:OOP family OmpA-OmpF porin
LIYNKSTPTNVSTEGIDFILTYLRNNPSASVDIIGHADELGRSEYNDKLSTARANSVKNFN